MTTPLLDVLIGELASLLSPVGEAVQSENGLNRILAELGLPSTSDDPLVPSIDDPIPAAADAGVVGALTQIASIGGEVEDLVSSSSASLDTVSKAFDLTRQAVASISSASGALSTGGVDGLGKDFLDLLITAWLINRHPLLRDVAALLTLIRPFGEQDAPPPVVASDGTLARLPFRVDRVQFGRLVDLLRDPLGTMRAEYGNAMLTDADADAIAQKLFPRLKNILSDLGISAQWGTDPGDAETLGDAAPIMGRSLLVYSDDPNIVDAPEAGVAITLSPASQGDLGVVISPFGTLNFSRDIGSWTTAAQFTAGVDVVAWGRHGVTLLASDSTTEFVASVTATLPKLDDGPAFVLGAPDGTRLEIGAMAFGLNAQLSESTRTFGLSADFTDVQLVLAPGSGDGFLDSILPADGVHAKANVGITWSNTSGLTFRGSATLDETLPVSVSIGGISVPNLHVALTAGDGNVRADLSAGLSASIGPVRVVIDRLGIAGALTFPDGAGSIGFADLGLGFQAPTGVGLSLDVAGVATGAGFLEHNPATGTYAGAMQLSLHDELTLSAFGLIATRLPNGEPGYSLLVFITAEGFEPIPLGLGFTLQAIGGLVGVNRTFDYDALSAGLKTDTLSTLLFPRDPIGNAPALIQALAGAFPAKSGSFLLGLLARITWFTPTLVTLDLGLVLEVGARTRLLVLGRVSALLPSADNDLVRLVLDTVGELDFDAGSLAVDAMLVDSRLVHRFPITGSAALRAHWRGGQQPGASGDSFLLAVGGFNPRFAPPAGFPALERVAIALTQGKNPRLVCEAYFAITSNTLQFGARASLYAEAIGFSLTGDVGFDALISWAPLHFIADFQGMVQLKRGSHNLFKLELEGTLEGPQPLRLSGKVTFSILWISFTVRVDATLADGPAAAGLAAVDVSGLLVAAIGATSNWRTQLTPGVSHGVAMRSLATGSGPVLDPLGQMVFDQQVVPLNLTRDVDSYSGAPVAGPRRFALAGQLNATAGTTVQGAFAPARYFALSDDEKLSAPSFESMDSGLVLGDATIRYATDAVEPAPLDYAPITLNPVGAASAPADGKTYQMPAASLAAHAATGAAARAPVRQVGRARFRNTSVQPVATVHAPEWKIVNTIDGTAPPAPAALASAAAAGAAAASAATPTWSEQHATLKQLNRGGAAWTMVPAHELAVA